MAIPSSYNATKIRYLLAGLCVQCGLKDPMKGRKWCRGCLLKINGNYKVKGYPT